VGHDPGGLVYSRTTHQVSFVRDSFQDPRERMWGDLHVVLEVYMLSIESGKFVVDVKHPGLATEIGLSRKLGESRSGRKELGQTLNVSENLVDAIDVRLPASAGISHRSRENDDEEPQPKKRKKVEDDGLIHADVLNKYPAIPPFERLFLSQAKRPRFTSIAPQLDVPDEAFIHRVGAELQARYPDASLTTPQHELVDFPPFLLFPWRKKDLQFVSQDVRDQWQSPRRPHMLDGCIGLYLTPDVLHAHASTLLLPFRLGEKCHVLVGDGSKVDRPAHDALYRHGMCNAMMRDHSTPLTAILVNWWEQTENEYWTVNASGVDGEEELWKKADTEEDAGDFQTEWVC
jgi:hypothetical protein